MNPDDVGFGAYNVLKQYAGFDYGVTKGEPGLSPLYLAASSGKAATYASDDFLGGEKLRGVRKSLEVLDRVLHDEEGTSTYREYFGVPSYTFGEPDFATADEALNWLRVEWDRLAAVREAVAQQRRADLCGVVYALQVPPADVSGFSIHRFMGIIVEGAAAHRCHLLLLDCSSYRVRRMAGLAGLEDRFRRKASWSGIGLAGIASHPTPTYGDSR